MEFLLALFILVGCGVKGDPRPYIEVEAEKKVEAKDAGAVTNPKDERKR